MGATAADSAGAIRPIVNVIAMPDGVTQRQVRSMKVSDGFGGWRLSWVPPVKAATLSFSKSPVLVGEAFNVIASVPAGTPEGAYAVFRSTEGHNYRVDFPIDSTTVTLANHSHAPTGAHDWYVDFYTAGGNTTFGPARQTAVGRSTASVSTRSWVMSYLCPNPTGLNHIPNMTFSMSLSNPAVVTRVELQIAPWSTGVFKTIGIWTPGGAGGYAAIPGSSWTWDFANSHFDSIGMWSARLMVTHTDGYVYECPHFGIDIRYKGLAAASSDYNPIVNTVVTLTASCNAGNCGHMYSAAQWFHNGGAGWNPDSGSNPVNWAAWGQISWLWREVFEDGSTIHSNAITVTPRADDPYVYAADNWYGGQSGTAGLIAAMRAARNAGKPLRVWGYWELAGDVWIPDGVTVDATDGSFAMIGGRFRNADPWPAYSMDGGTRGYNGGGFAWRNGYFDGRGDGVFTLSHSPGFSIIGATFINWCSTGNTGHAIEINSSGGNDNQLGEYEGFTVVVNSNKFGGVSGQRAWGNDEPIHWDFAWSGSGHRGYADFTKCHNVQIDGNVFHVNFGGGPQFAICAIGAHDPSAASIAEIEAAGGWSGGSAGSPIDRHNHFRICGNEIHGATGYAGSSLKFDKGAIHVHRTRQVWVTGNSFLGCTPNRNVTGWNSGDATKATSHTGGGGAYNRNPAGGYVWVAANGSNNGGNPDLLVVKNT
jgi:hypothetical protein